MQEDSPRDEGLAHFASRLLASDEFQFLMKCTFCHVRLSVLLDRLCSINNSFMFFHGLTCTAKPSLRANVSYFLASSGIGPIPREARK